MRLSLKLFVTLFFYLFIALMVVVFSAIGGIFTYPLLILASLIFIMALKLKVPRGQPYVGAIAALVSMGLVIGTLAFSGAIVIGPLKDNFIDILFIGIVIQLIVSIAEEMSFRASVFQGLDDELGIVPAALLSAAGFAALHIPSMDLVGIGVPSGLIALGTIFFAGIALALLYAYGGLLNAIAFHFVWNFIEYTLFAMGPLEGAISVSQPGPGIVTGGAFGPEASVVALAVAALLAAVLWLYYTRVKKAPAGGST
jgi:membrane protease YdiL (CAAX protease family)